MQISPTKKRRLLIGIAIYCLVVLVSAATIWAISSDARREIDALAVANADSSQWSLAQSEVEFLALVNATRASMMGDATPAEVRKRFNIFYSRIQTIKASQSFSEVRVLPEVQQSIGDLEAFLNETVATIDADDETLSAALPEIQSKFDALHSALRNLSLASVRVFAKHAEMQRGQVSGALKDLGLIAFTLLATLIGVVGGLLASIRESRRQTSEIALTQGRLQAIISTSLDGILVVNKAGVVLDYNGAAEGIFGYTREEALGADMADLIIPDHLRDAHYKGMARYRETSIKHVVGSGLHKLEAKRNDGSIFPVELSINSAESEEGEIFISFLRDISQRVESEQELVEARDKALAGEKAKADLLAVMSHEMRTPLNGVLGSLQLLADTNLDKQQEKYVDVMDISGKMLLEHVNNVLDISRVDAGKAVVAEQEFSLVELLDETVESLKGQAEGRGNSLEVVRLGTHIDRVIGDQTRLRQILFNLLGNAIKFTEHGKVSIEVDANTHNELVEFRIIDSGIGIAEDDLDRIFSDFVTLDASYQREVEGTGLGLGIVKRLVELLGGEIGVESVPGEGSVFWFDLPLPRVAERIASRPISINAPEEPLRHPSKVLIVEDNEINRMVAREMLMQLDCDVSEATDGQEGVQMAEAEKFDLILMDISMPKIDGTVAAKMIKEGSGPNVKTAIVALTAHALPEDVARFKAAGMSDVITKPLSSGRLSAVLTQNMWIEVSEPSADALVKDEMVRTFGIEKAEELERRAFSQLSEGFDELESLIVNDMPHDDVSALAHKLVGTASMFGLTDIREDLVSIENSNPDGNRDRLLSSVSAGRRKMLKHT